jgi:PKD repeat protein
MRSIFLNKRLLFLATLSVFLSLSSVHARKIRLDREGDGNTVKNNITAAIAAANQSNDTIFIEGSDIGTFSGDFPQNFTNGNITFLGKNTNPDSFPVLTIRGTNWNHFWNNVGNCTTRFENVVLQNCSSISNQNNSHKCVIENVVIRGYTNNAVFAINGDNSNAITIKNTIFISNKRPIFPRLNSHNSNSPYGSVTNCTFYGNDTVNADTPSQARSLLTVTNCIFHPTNKNIALTNSLRNVYTYCLLPTSARSSPWGIGCDFKDDPKFIKTTPSAATDFRFFKDSPARDKGSTPAPPTDISGKPRDPHPDIGAWEWVDTNVAPVRIELSKNSIAENNLTGVLIAKFTTIDSNVSDKHTYRFVSGDTTFFSIKNDSLLAKAVFNYESKSAYSIRVRSTDPGNLFFDTTFIIRITDVNETVTEVSLSNSSIAENIPGGTFIGRLISTDPDSNDIHTYSFVSGDTAFFSIRSDSLLSKVSFNYEEDSIYTITILSTDSDGHYLDQTFNIRISDIKEPPESLYISSTTVPENVPSNTLIGRFTTIDRDSGSSFTYSFASGISDNTNFSISGDSLLTKSMLDYEDKKQYTIMVRSYDGNHSITDTFTITVTNVNDRPTAIILADTTVEDSTAANTIIGTLAATDQDSNEVFTYSLPVYGDNSYFRIDGDTLKADSVLSFIKKPVYSIRIKVKDMGGNSLSKDFNIIILSKPYILKEPSSAIAGEGKSVTFSIEAAGSLPLSYKWYSTSSPGMVIDSSPTLTINNLSMTHNKSFYYCVVSNTIDSIQSKNCTLYVYKKPTITTDLANTITIIASSPCTLSVSATGDSISYLWIKNGSDTLSSKTSSVIFSSAKASDSGSYQCFVHNIFDTIPSTTAFLNVLIPPTFDTVPDSVVVFDGDTAKIRISVSGTPPFSYKWIKNNVDSVGSSAELVLPHVSLSDNGSDYYCIVTGVKTDSTSKIYLKVKPAPPVVDSQPTTVSIIENQDAVFSIKAHGTAPLQYKWFFLDDLATVLSDSTILVLNKVQIAQHNSKIFCQVSNIAGTISSDTVLLQVYPERPIISTHPLSQTTNEAKRVKFTVEATGTPPLNFLWLKVGTNDTLSKLDSLILDPVKKKDAGSYYCIVRNSAGVDTSDTATLIVDDELKAPVITSHPKSQEKYIGDSVVFKVEATGYPPPNFQWFINNESLSGETSNTLVLRGVSFDNNSDSVKCMVFNSEGTVFCSTAVLTITPAPIADFNATPITIPVNGSVQFTNASSGIYSDVIWNFGDSTTSTEESPKHIYVNSGLYDVSLIVTGKAGNDTMVKTGLIYVYKQGENPVRISAKYLRGTEIEITLSNLDKIEPQIFPPVYDSLGIWISKVSLPENAYTSEKLITYSRDIFKNKSSFIDTLSLPQAKITWYLMSGLYLTNGKISAFNAGNGTEVLLMEKEAPSNTLSISGRHLGGDSVLITFIASSPLDTEKVDSVLFCFAFDSVGLDYRGQFSSSFSATEFAKSSILEKKIFNDVFSIGSHLMWCGVKLKGKNDSLSLPVTSSFLIENDNISNPVILSGQAISSSAIRLSWNDLNPDSVSGMRIWYSVDQIPLGILKRPNYSLIELNPSQNSCIVEYLNYSTSYCFAAQVVNKQGIWSEITEKSRVIIKTTDPSDSLEIPNTITLHTPLFDTLSASIKLSWCVDTTGIGDSLELGISSNNTGFAPEISQINQILPVRNLCDSATLKLQKISFNTQYFISLWLRKKGGRWAFPVHLSQQDILTPHFTREPLSFFDPAVIFDTVFAFNDNLILSKDSHFGVKEIFNNTAVFYQGKQHNGMIAVGNGFYFTQNNHTPAFWIGLRYNVPVGFSAGKVKLYRENANGVLVEHDAINDTLRKIVSVYTNKTDLPFILLIDTVAPVLNFKGNTDKTVYPGKNTTDTVTITDNILNTKYQFFYSTGKDPLTIRIDTVLSGRSQQLILTVPKEFSSVETGIRAELRVTDGNNLIVRNLSKQVHIDKVETRIFPLQWTPFSVSAQLSSTSPDSLIKHLAQTDSSSYDGRYARVFYWVPTSGNVTAKDRWVEYSNNVKSLFNLSPGKTFWIKTLKEKSINLGSALTMSLKDTVKIVLPKKEFTDLTLPYNFPVRIKDIIESSGMDSIAIYKWSNDSGTFVTRGHYIPGKANRQNINDSLDWKYHNAYYSIYNMYSKDTTLKIPPIPVSMSPELPLKKEAQKNTWGTTVNCRIDSSRTSEVYCGYADKAGQIYYPPSPGFVNSRVKIFHRKANRFFGDYICGDLSNGGITQELAFENNESYPVQFSFCMADEGNIPSGFSSSIFNTATGEWEKSGKIMVGANNIEYRWLVIAGKEFMEHFKNNALSWKYGLRSVYANPVRNAAVFKFTIPIGAKERVRFTIFDAMGRKIWEKTISHPLSSGEHTLVWNGNNSRGGKVSNGMYFVVFSVLDSKGKAMKSFDSRLVYVH